MAAGPFAEIDQTAAIAAKREIRLCRFGRFLTDRATELNETIARHNQFAGSSSSFEVTRLLAGGTNSQQIQALNDFRHQIIVVRCSNAAAIEFTFFRFFSFGVIVYEHFAVDLRRVHRRTALKQQVGFS